MILMIDKTTVKQGRKIGGSLMMPLTGYIKENKFYRVQQLSEKEITISQIEV